MESIIISFVIVEYHSTEEVNTCAESIREHLNIPYEIIISSNSCYNEEERNHLEATNKDRHLHWYFNEKNGGFAYAMNNGLSHANGRYLAIMNSDCTIECDLRQIIDFMDNHSEIGAIAPQMKDADGNIQDTARPYVSLPRYIWRQTRRIIGCKITILSRDMDYGQIQTVDWLIGAFIIVSRKAYEATNGLDDKFFMYAEDLDWCTRIRQQGFEVVYYPKAVITYKGTRRARSNSKYAKIFIRSHIRYWKKFGFFYGYPKRTKRIF